MNGPDDPWEKWVTWIACHPRTVAYIVAVTTANLVLSIVEVFAR